MPLVVPGRALRASHERPQRTRPLYALDGLVTIGGSKAIEALEAVRDRLPRDRNAITAEWVDEALMQMRVEADEQYRKAADYLMEKNAELYRRLD